MTTAPASKPSMLTITLTDRPPVRVVKDDWSIVASASDHEEHRNWKLIVRQHGDGRSIVYGIYDTNWQGEHGRRGGVLVAAKEDIAAAIKTVGQSLDFEERLIQQCIADLPAEEI